MFLLPPQLLLAELWHPLAEGGMSLPSETDAQQEILSKVSPALIRKVIIKIRKESRQSGDVKDEVSYYGVIDQTCIFTPSEDKTSWSNGLETYETSAFEEYLTKI